jgi:hypothetical protein
LFLLSLALGKETITMIEDLMLSRRQKTLSSISNYIPLHILLNEPSGITFSITVSKSWTIEQLARQIEAEYAYLVEREIPGGSSFPVIECGALFDHVEFKGSKSKATEARGNGNAKNKQVSRRVSLKSIRVTAPALDASSVDQEDKQAVPQACDIPPVANDENEGEKLEQEHDHVHIGNGGKEEHVEAGHEDEKEEHGEDELDDHDDDDLYDLEEEEEEEEEEDHRTEAESRGVQLRFSDKVEDVLDRDSTVHVVNIDQGKQLEKSV